MEENTSRSYSYLSEKRKKEAEELKKKLKEQEDARLRRAEKFLTSHPPSRIEAELNEYIIDQPSLTKNVADFLYYHVLRFKYPYLPSRPILICGPSGSGSFFAAIDNLEIAQSITNAFNLFSFYYYCKN